MRKEKRNPKRKENTDESGSCDEAGSDEFALLACHYSCFSLLLLLDLRHQSIGRRFDSILKHTLK